jgi:malonyl-CoA/methylmalonyl-CoA synthetase
VQEVAIVGLPDPDLGEQVIAAVVGTATADDVIAYCREHLAAYKKPRRVVFLPALPRNALGKLQKHVLRAQLESREDA